MIRNGTFRSSPNSRREFLSGRANGTFLRATTRGAARWRVSSATDGASRSRFSISMAARRRLAELSFPAETARDRGTESYPDYLREVARHKIVLQLDRSRVPGQVAGDALLCRMPAWAATARSSESRFRICAARRTSINRASSPIEILKTRTRGQRGGGIAMARDGTAVVSARESSRSIAVRSFANGPQLPMESHWVNRRCLSPRDRVLRAGCAWMR